MKGEEGGREQQVDGQVHEGNNEEDGQTDGGQEEGLQQKEMEEGTEMEKVKKTTLIMMNKQWSRTLNGRKWRYWTVLILLWRMWIEMDKEGLIKIKKWSVRKK